MFFSYWLSLSYNRVLSVRVLCMRLHFEVRLWVDCTKDSLNKKTFKSFLFLNQQKPAMYIVEFTVLPVSVKSFPENGNFKEF